MPKALEPMPEEDERLLDSSVSRWDIYTSEGHEIANKSAAVASDDQSSDDVSVNMFDTLCVGLMTSLQMVQASLDELLCLKDELMNHSLPPILLSKLVLCTSKVFRSISDCRVPAGELIRMVHVYSESWEEKSTALKKLHEGYASMKLQLDIALRKLALNDVKVKFAESQRRILNWEKLYLRTVVAQSLGEKYDETVEHLRQKSAEGVDALKDHVLKMNGLHRRKKSSSLRKKSSLKLVKATEDGDQFMSDLSQLTPNLGQVTMADDELPTVVSQQSQVITNPVEDFPSTLQPSAEHVDMSTLADDTKVDVVNVAAADIISFDKNSDIFSVKDNDEDIHDKDGSIVSESSRDSSHHHSHHATPVTIKPVMADAQVSTSDPNYDIYLYVRVHAPDGLGEQPVQLTVSLMDQNIRTGILHPNIQNQVKNNPTVAPPGGTKPRTQSKSVDSPPEVKRFGRRLIGLHQSNTGNETESVSMVQQHTENLSRYEDCIFHLTDDELVHRSGPQLSVTVLEQVYGKPVAVATIAMDDLNSLDLETFTLPALDGTTDDVINPSSALQPSTVKFTFAECPVSVFSHCPQLDYVHPISYPLYPAVGYALYPLSGTSEGGETGEPDMLANIKLCCFWARRERPKTLHRFTQSESLSEVLLDVTGFDLSKHGGLQPETLERSTSPMGVEGHEDSMTRAEYMKVLCRHEEEMELLKAEYESRLNDLTEAVQLMQDSQTYTSPRQHTSRSHERSHRSPRRSNSSSPLRSKPTLEPIHEPTKEAYVSRNAPAKNSEQQSWGEEIPKNFFDRLQHFEERVKQRRRELCDRSREQVSDSIERRLATEYKLSPAHNMTAGHDGIDQTSTQDVSLPAVFMPTKVRDLNVYNPRAHQYFHATGSSRVRLTQPPSIIQLPPIPKTTLSVVNIFDISRNFKRTGSADSWYVNNYINMHQLHNSAPPPLSGDNTVGPSDCLNNGTEIANTTSDL